MKRQVREKGYFTDGRIIVQGNLYNVYLLPIYSVVISCVGQFGLPTVLEQNYSCNQQLYYFVLLRMVNPLKSNV